MPVGILTSSHAERDQPFPMIFNIAGERFFYRGIYKNSDSISSSSIFCRVGPPVDRSHPMFL